MKPLTHQTPGTQTTSQNREVSHQEDVTASNRRGAKWWETPESGSEDPVKCSGHTCPHAKSYNKSGGKCPGISVRDECTCWRKSARIINLMLKDWRNHIRSHTKVVATLMKTIPVRKMDGSTCSTICGWQTQLSTDSTFNKPMHTALYCGQDLYQ